MTFPVPAGLISSDFFFCCHRCDPCICIYNRSKKAPIKRKQRESEEGNNHENQYDCRDERQEKIKSIVFLRMKVYNSYRFQSVQPVH